MEMEKKIEVNTSIPISEEIEEIERELGLRKSVYPHLIAKGGLTKEKANKQFLTLQNTLRRLQLLKMCQDAGLNTFGFFETEKQAIDHANNYSSTEQTVTSVVESDGLEGRESFPDSGIQPQGQPEQPGVT